MFNLQMSSNSNLLKTDSGTFEKTENVKNLYIFQIKRSKQLKSRIVFNRQ